MLPEPLIRYSNPPTNIVGTALFLTYIILALLLTTNISFSLYHLSRTRRNANTKSLIILSALSFTTLSYHMLLFLLKSYSRWRMTKTFFASSDTADTSLWSWMLESSLFTSFAEELVGDPPSAVVTNLALLETWSWNVWVGGRAREKGLDKRTMLPYILLGQILPATFSASLFATRIHLTTPPQPSAHDLDDKQNHAKQPPPAELSSTIPLVLTTILATTLFNILPRFASSPFLIPFVLATRAVLLLPHLSWTFGGGIGGVRTTGTMISTRMTTIQRLVFGALLANVVGYVATTGVGDVGRALWRGGEGVKALGWDAGIGLGVWGWIWWCGEL